MASLAAVIWWQQVRAERLGEEWVNPEQLGPWDGGDAV
jgi:hypothetical protein